MRTPSHFSLRSWGYRPREELWLFQCGSPKARRVAMLPGPAPCTWVLEAAGGWCCDTRVEGCEMLGCVKAALKEGNIMMQPNKREQVLRVFPWFLLSQVHYDYDIVFRLLVYNWYVLLPVFFPFYFLGIFGVPAFPSSTPPLSPGSSSGRGFTTEVMTTNSLIRDDSWRFCFFWGGSFWERQRDSVFVLDGNCSSCGDCSDWKDTLLVLSFRSSFVGATWCQSTRSLRIFGSSCTGFSKKLREFSVITRETKHEFRGCEVLKENHLESSVVM